jgi:hypothetical protein
MQQLLQQLILSLRRRWARRPVAARPRRVCLRVEAMEERMMPSASPLAHLPLPDHRVLALVSTTGGNHVAHPESPVHGDKWRWPRPSAMDGQGTPSNEALRAVELKLVGTPGEQHGKTLLKEKVVVANLHQGLVSHGLANAHQIIRSLAGAAADAGDDRWPPGDATGDPRGDAAMGVTTTASTVQFGPNFDGGKWNPNPNNAGSNLRPGPTPSNNDDLPHNPFSFPEAGTGEPTPPKSDGKTLDQILGPAGPAPSGEELDQLIGSPPPSGEQGGGSSSGTDPDTQTLVDWATSSDDSPPPDQPDNGGATSNDGSPPPGQPDNGGSYPNPEGDDTRGPHSPCAYPTPDGNPGGPAGTVAALHGLMTAGRAGAQSTGLAGALSSAAGLHQV